MNLPSLYYRCKCMDMIVTYKIIQGLVHIPCRELFVLSTRSNGLKLYKEYAKTNTRLHDFKNRVINDWNSLPPYIVNASDMIAFKTLLDEHWINLRFLTL